MVEVKELDTPEDWSSFISNIGSAHHAWSWEWREIMFQAFGHQPYYLGAFRNGKCVGVLPLFLIRGLLFGRALVSVPYLNAGGILAEDSEAGSALLQRALQLRVESKSRYLELRQIKPIEFGQNLSVRTHKVAMVLPLPSTPDALFSSFNKKLRSQIRRPEKDGVSTDSEAPSDERVDAFYRVYSKNMRDLGTPVFSKKLPELTAKHFRERCRISIARHGDTVIGAGLTIINNGRAEIPWASTLREFNHLSANMALYWQVIRDCCENGANSFDFGRSSPDSGTFRFKAQWGAEPVPLHWYYDGESPNIAPSNTKFSLAIKVWQHLPLFAANGLGPLVAKSLP